MEDNNTTELPRPIGDFKHEITVTIRRPDQPAESYTIDCQGLAKKIEELANYKPTDALASQKG